MQYSDLHMSQKSMLCLPHSDVFPPYEQHALEMVKIKIINVHLHSENATNIITYNIILTFHCFEVHLHV